MRPLVAVLAGLALLGSARMGGAASVPAEQEAVCRLLAASLERQGQLRRPAEGGREAARAAHLLELAEFRGRDLARALEPGGYRFADWRFRARGPVLEPSPDGEALVATMELACLPAATVRFGLPAHSPTGVLLFALRPGEVVTGTGRFLLNEGARGAGGALDWAAGDRSAGGPPAFRAEMRAMQPAAPSGPPLGLTRVVGAASAMGPAPHRAAARALPAGRPKPARRAPRLPPRP